MYEEIKEMFEGCSKEYITPHYWRFLETMVGTYLEANNPKLPIEHLCFEAGRNRVTYYRFVKRFYGTPAAFWDLMERARVLNNKLAKTG